MIVLFYAKTRLVAAQKAFLRSLRRQKTPRKRGGSYAENKLQ